MKVGDVVKIKKNYGVGTINVVIEKIYSDNKILCLNPLINCHVMISKFDIINKRYYENKRVIKQNIHKQKNQEYYMRGSLTYVKEVYGYQPFMA